MALTGERWCVWLLKGRVVGERCRCVLTFECVVSYILLDCYIILVQQLQEYSSYASDSRLRFVTLADYICTNWRDRQYS